MKTRLQKKREWCYGSTTAKGAICRMSRKTQCISKHYRKRKFRRWNKMAEKGRKDGSAAGAGIGVTLFNANANFSRCRNIWKVIHNSIATCSGSVHQWIRESKMRTSNLILCEDANSIGYERSKTKVCMIKLMASVHCSFKCANRNN